MAENALVMFIQRHVQVTLVDHEMRFTPAVQKCREHLRKGTIGPIKAVYVRPLPAALGKPCLSLLEV